MDGSGFLLRRKISHFGTIDLPRELVSFGGFVAPQPRAGQCDRMEYAFILIAALWIFCVGGVVLLFRKVGDL